MTSWRSADGKTMRTNYGLTPEERLSRRIREPSGCLVVQTKYLGYPKMWVEGREVSVHRYVLGLKIGRPLRSDEHACHTCDNKRCSEPEHLYVGNPKTNSTDVKNRNRNPQFLSREHVEEMKFLLENYVPYDTIAEMYHVEKCTVMQLAAGRVWENVPFSDGYSRDNKSVIKRNVGGTHFLAKWTEKEVREARELFDSGVPGSEIARMFNKNRDTTYSVVRRRTWRHLP